MSKPDKRIISKLSDRELEKYIEPNSRFVSQAISYAFEILESRGREFSSNEKDLIDRTIIEKKEKEDKIVEPVNYWKQGIVVDESSPKLYSRLSIYLFSIFFGVYAGSILQALNCKYIDNKKGFYITLIFGISYSIFQVIIIEYIQEIFINTNINLTYFFSGLGAVILDYYFWNNFISKEFTYRKKEIWLPLIIFTAIYSAFFYLVYFN